MIYLASLAVFSGLSLNLLLQFAFGTKGAAGDTHHKTGERKKLPFIQLGILFISVLVLWVFFNIILPGHWEGFSEFFLFFPCSALVCMGFEFLIEQVLPKIFPQKFPKPKTGKKTFSALTAYDCLVPASLMITSAAAESFAGVFVIALFFALGNLVAMMVLNEIRRKSTMEWLPRYLRGSPLIIISMGLISFISASVAGICFRILEVF
jgi:electron transport complex protein RnfA